VCLAKDKDGFGRCSAPPLIVPNRAA